MQTTQTDYPTLRVRHIARNRCVVLFPLLWIVGCGADPNRPIEVDGRITLDGEPLAQATVEFRPPSGRPSAGKTDDDGRYTLRYSETELGALPGEHEVFITTVTDSGDDADKKTERVPVRYNRSTVLRVEVGQAARTHNFELQSK